MLRLFLLRHAKSSWANPTLSDFHRPLNKRGRKDLPAISSILAGTSPQPDRILCSASLRTRQTLAGILPALGGETDIKILDSLYEGHAPDYLVLLRVHAQNSKNLMIIGHNTGMQDIALTLIGKGDRALIADMEYKFPTAALAIIEFDTDSWEEVSLDTGTLVTFVKPRDLTGPSEPESDAEQFETASIDTPLPETAPTENDTPEPTASEKA
ncbi:MAG: histidine phosphatase family protein [Cohaesibacter sp.]|jgi:phosphohistidine phosphatase|nr:histidine phosphatase family protein [Cohaesibacter sp.]